MSEIIKRVAEAIYDATPQWGSLWDKNDEIKASFMAQARAALCAMREPTKPMVDAGAVFAEYAVEAAWKEMIDTALKDPT